MRSNMFEDPRKCGGIWPDEIAKATHRARSGGIVRILDTRMQKRFGESDGYVKTARIAACYPHVVTLDNGISATYAQLAMYYRLDDEQGYIS